MKKVLGILGLVALIVVSVLLLRRERTVDPPPIEKSAVEREKTQEPNKEEIVRAKKEQEEEEFRAFEKRWEGKEWLDPRDEIKGITTVEGKVDRLVMLWYWEKRISMRRSFTFGVGSYLQIVREIGIEAIPYLMKYLLKKDANEEDKSVQYTISSFWLEKIRIATTGEAAREFFNELQIPLKEKAEWALYLQKWDRNGTLWYPRGMEYAPYMLEFLCDPDEDIAWNALSFFSILDSDSPESVDQKRTMRKKQIDKFEKLLLERDMGETILAGIASEPAEKPAVRAIYARYMERSGSHKDYRSEQRNLSIVKLLKEVYGKDPESINIIVKALQSVPDALRKEDRGGWSIEDEYRLILASLGHEESFQIVLHQIDSNLRDAGSARLSYLAKTKDPRLIPYAMKWLSSLDPVKEAWLARDIMEELTNITGFGVEFRYSMIACGDKPETCDHHAHIAKHYRQWMEWWEQNKQKYR